tara:strand:- start:45862 stop:46740 length:879 start_codon:yes stop_codon:yes gene_type:complete
MLSTFTTTQKGILYALIGFSAFVISDSCAKWLTPHYPVLQIIGWTYFFSLIVGVALSPFMGGLKATFRTKKMQVHLWRSLFNVGLAVSVVIAFAHLPITTVYPVLFLAPFLITIAAIPIYKETVSPISWLIILLGFTGVLIALRPWTGEISVWVLFAFFTTFCITGISLLARAMGKDETLLSFSFYPNIVNTVLLFPYSLMAYPLPHIEHLPVFVLAGFMLTCGISGVACAFLNARYAAVSPLHYSQLALAFLIGYFVFDERPDMWMIGGAGLIVISGIMLVCASPNNQDAS